MSRAESQIESCSAAFPRSASGRPQALFLSICAVAFIGLATLTIRMCSSPCCGGMPMPGSWIMSMVWMPMPGQTWFSAAFDFMTMWAVMMAAMMLPCLAPMLLVYRCSVRPCGPARLMFLTTVAGFGYLLVWTLMGAIVYPIGRAMAAEAMRSDAVSRSVPIAIAATLLLVGVLQFSNWKQCRLGCCRSATVAEGHREPTLLGALCHGCGFGVCCVRCCAGLMLVLLVLGVMSLPAMAIITIATAAERLLPYPAVVARASGVVAVIAGCVTAGIAILNGHLIPL